MDNLLLYYFIVCLIILQIIWYFTDPRPLKQKIFYAVKVKNKYSRGSLLLAVVLIIIWINFANKLPLQVPPTMYDFFFAILGTTCFTYGCIIAVWARLTMNKKWLPAGEGHDFKRQPTLFTTGPFSYTRNPIYLGNLLMFIGMGLGLRTYLLLLIFYPYWYFSSTVRHEEALLTKHFGKKYQQYMAKVPRFL